MMIVGSGHPKTKIVVEDSNQAIETSNILQSAINSISGAELSITIDNQDVSGTHIYVGHGKSSESFGIEIPPPGITSQIDEDWHYRGTIYAGFVFLEMIGHREGRSIQSIYPSKGLSDIC